MLSIQVHLVDLFLNALGLAFVAFFKGLITDGLLLVGSFLGK